MLTLWAPELTMRIFTQRWTLLRERETDTLNHLNYVVFKFFFISFGFVFFSCCSGFKEYLQTAPAYDFPKYRQLVYNVTQTFNNLSAEVIDIESKLRESGQHSVSNLVRKIQLKEKEKLEMVRFSVTLVVGQLEEKWDTGGLHCWGEEMQFHFNAQ